MAYNKDDAPGRKFFKDFCECGAGFRVKVVRHFIQNENPGLSYNRTGYCKALHFTAGKGLAVQSDACIKAVGQSLDHIVHSA